MAKVVLVCLRNPRLADHRHIAHHVRSFLATLCPDNLVPAAPVVGTDGHGLFLGVFNPADTSVVRDCSAFTGWLADPGEPWWKVGAPAPLGSYALLRTSRDAVEAVADYAASRTLWLAQTDEVFIASTTQRAIPYFLGSFESNPTAIAWMLSAGTLGPTAGWDSRARPLGSGGVARLDRMRWRLAVHEPPVQFRADPSSDAVHAEKLRTALEATLATVGFDPSRWVLPLSGGFDSRAILLMMQHRQGMRTVTWGRQEALDQPGTDASVARQVAKAIGVSHQYFATDLSHEPIETLLDRFLVAGDGRTASVLAYMDGFNTWRSLFESGVHGVIRGDHGFGPGPAPPFRSAVEVLHFNSMTRWRDHAGLPGMADFDMPQFEDQDWPEAFNLQDNESFADWRDRLYQLYRIPFFHAGQSDLKAAYVEVASPLFVRPIMDLTRTHPEHLRNGKRLFKQVVAPYDVPIRYASVSARMAPADLLGNQDFAQLLGDELSSRRFRHTFTGTFADYLIDRLAGVPREPASGRLPKARRHLRRLLPSALRLRLRRDPTRRSLDPGTVALRAYIVNRMLERLSSDAQNGVGLCIPERPRGFVGRASVQAPLSSQFL